MRGQRRQSAVPILLFSLLPHIATKLSYVSEDQLIYTDFGGAQDAATVDAATGAVQQRTIPLVDDETLPVHEPSQSESTGAADMPTEPPRGSLRATFKRIGAAVPEAEDEKILHDALRDALGRVSKTSLLRGLLFERGGRCPGCTERHEFVDAVLSNLWRPLVGRHSLPLFLYDSPLMPHTEMGLHLYEPRYKLLCRKALKAERLFGFTTGTVGTLARIKEWRFSDDDATDGTCHVTVVGLRRFKVGRQWQDKCSGCNTGPLHYADVTYFNDTETREKRLATGVALVKEGLRLHHALVDAGAQRDLEKQLGATPTVRDRGFAMSFWLAAACAALDERCKMQAPDLLASTSTAERMERVLKVQRSLAGKRFSSRG